MQNQMNKDVSLSFFAAYTMLQLGDRTLPSLHVVTVWGYERPFDLFDKW